jgi:hypothetical protein
MALTNAEKQERWRARHQLVLTDSAEGIADRLMAMEDRAKLRKVWALVRARLKDLPCEKCKGSGLYGQRAFKCGGKNPVCETGRFPCPECRPLEYFEASGGELRNEGRYAEAIQAAMSCMDDFAAGDTLLAWGVSLKEAQAAIREAGAGISLAYLRRLRDIARDVPPGKRKQSWGFYREWGTK